MGNGFIPDTPKVEKEVPFFDDVTSDAGWQGHSTTKSIEALKSEVIASIGRLGGLVTGFVRGGFGNRDGFRLTYAIEASTGQMIPGQIDIAALPVKPSVRSNYRTSSSKSLETRKEKSLKMALYMLRMALDGTWFLQQLSPGYCALMPWMLMDDGKTVTEKWMESSVMGNLLPAPEDAESWIEGEIEEN